MKNKSFIKPIVVVAGITLATSAFGLYYWRQENRLPILEIYVFAPKSGRSIYIRTPKDNRILIDGGSNSEIIRSISEILPFYSRRIDMVIATNDAGKNIGGLIDVIQRYEVGDIYFPKHTLHSLNLASSTDQIYETLVQTANTLDINVIEVAMGQTIDLDSKTKLDVLFPADPANFPYSKASPPEVLFNISHGLNNILFAGSASPKIQKYIASTSMSTRLSDVIIFSHSAYTDKVSVELAQKFHPSHIVYSKALSKNQDNSTELLLSETVPTTTQTSKSIKKKKKVDPLAYLSAQNRFNLKEGGGVKIVSDGSKVQVEFMNNTVGTF